MMLRHHWRHLAKQIWSLSVVPCNAVVEAGNIRGWLFTFINDTTNNISNSAILASSSESEDGGVSPPPPKKQRVSVANMQSNGCPQHNGESEEVASTSRPNGTCSATANGEVTTPEDKQHLLKNMSRADQDVVRLIGQHLRGLGLKWVPSLLSECSKED